MTKARPTHAPADKDGSKEAYDYNTDDSSNGEQDYCEVHPPKPLLRPDTF